MAFRDDNLRVSYYIDGNSLSYLIEKYIEYMTLYPDDYIEGAFVQEFYDFNDGICDRFHTEVNFYTASESQEICDMFNDLVGYNDV